jgi:hypothetical protein
LIPGDTIPAEHNGPGVFVDPIGFVIKSAGSPLHCNGLPPTQYKWYRSYPELKECNDPIMLPLDHRMSVIGLGKSIYTKQQLDEVAAFQDSRGARRAFTAETAELAYGSMSLGSWTSC